MVNLKSKIYVAGHNGLVGSAIVRKLKEKGYFVYRGWMKPKENECRHLNSYEVTEIDRIFYTYGPPFGEPWEFDSGVVYWFGMIPMMGMMLQNLSTSVMSLWQ